MRLFSKLETGKKTFSKVVQQSACTELPVTEARYLINVTPNMDLYILECQHTLTGLKKKQLKHLFRKTA